MIKLRVEAPQILLELRGRTLRTHQETAVEELRTSKRREKTIENI